LQLEVKVLWQRGIFMNGKAKMLAQYSVAFLNAGQQSFFPAPWFMTHWYVNLAERYECWHYLRANLRVP
jgi:hypothetical protein